MQIRILGPLEIVDGDRRVSIGAPKQRALLAALILRANRVVPTGELAERVWGDAPPSSARLTLQGYVLRLRRALAPLDGVSIVTEPAGYLLRADPEEVDVCRFESLLTEADHRARTGDAAAEAAPHFVGREAETARLLAGEETETGPMVCAVAGMAGVGKTALVLHAAHRLGERYPDGRLYVDLGGTGYLPLAVRIVAARLAGHPEWRLGRLTDQLADEHQRLDRLAAGDLEVRSSIAMSHDALAPEHRRPFRLVGLLDLPEVAPWMIAALLDRPANETEDIVDALVDARLLEASRADADGGYRYRCHDLVRLFARERALATDPREEREAALTRVLEALLAFARRADDALPSRRLRLPESSPVHATPDGTPPLAWFEANRATLAVAVRQAVALGLPELAWRLAAATLNFYDLRGYWDDWGRTHHDALTAAQAHGDLHGETVMRYGLGILATVRDRYKDAAEHLSAALTGCRELAAPIAEARVLNALGDVHHICDRLDEAFVCFQDALRLSKCHGDLTGAANSLLDLGLVHRDQNRPAESLDHLSRALTTFRAADDVYGEAHVLRFLAATHYHSRGDLTAARRHATQAIVLFRRLGDDLAEIRSLRMLAMVLAAEDRRKPAIRLLDRCLAAFRERGDLFGEASTLWSLSRLCARCQAASKRGAAPRRR